MVLGVIEILLKIVVGRSSSVVGATRNQADYGLSKT
jgi:hypothetical protein